MNIKKIYPEDFSGPSDLDQNYGQAKINSDQHHGQIIERVIRRAHIGISEIARNLNISRRTLYNWFEMETISLDIIRKVGHVIGHDFSNELPEEFLDEDLNDIKPAFGPPLDANGIPKNDALYYWMERYIKLLETVNQNLINNNNKVNNETIN